MTTFLSFRCESCNARLKAPIQMIGQVRPCPSCRECVILQPIVPPPADPVLVFEDIPLPPQELAGWSFRA